MPTRLKNLLQGPLLVFGAGIFFIVLAIVKAYGGCSSLNWSAIGGIVTVSQVKKHYHRDIEQYNYLFEYSYQVNGRKYFGKRYSFASGPYDSSSGVKKYKVMDKLKVYYDPQNPAESTVVRGPSWYLLFPFMGGLIFAVGGFFWVRETWREDLEP